MQPHEAVSLYARLRASLESGGERTSGLRLGAEFKVPYLSLATRVHARQEDLNAALRRFEPEKGWLTFQSEVHKFTSAPDLGRGFVLYGEMIDDTGRSLHIAEDGVKGWKTTIFEEHAEQGEAPGATPCLAESISLIGQGAHSGGLDSRAVDSLGYTRYWRHDPEHGYLPWVARFTGFETGGTS